MFKKMMVLGLMVGVMLGFSIEAMGELQFNYLNKYNYNVFFPVSGVFFATDSSGNIYGTNDYDPNNKIKKFDKEMNQFTGWGSSIAANTSGSVGPMTIDKSRGILFAISNNSIRTPNGDNISKLSKFNLNGEFLDGWNINVPEMTSFRYFYVDDIAIDSNNSVIYMAIEKQPLNFTPSRSAAEQNDYKIIKYDYNGNILASWGRNGTGVGEFKALHELAVDSQGRVYAMDRMNDRIQVFNSAGIPLRQWTITLGANINHIGIDRNDNVFVSDQMGHKYFIYDTNGNLIGQLGTPGNRDQDFSFGPFQILFGAEDVIYADSNPYLKTFKQAAVVVNTTPGSGGVKPIEAPLKIKTEQSDIPNAPVNTIYMAEIKAADPLAPRNTRYKWELTAGQSEMNRIGLRLVNTGIIKTGISGRVYRYVKPCNFPIKVKITNLSNNKTAEKDYTINIVNP